MFTAKMAGYGKTPLNKYKIGSLLLYKFKSSEILPWPVRATDYDKKNRLSDDRISLPNKEQ